MTPRIQQYAAEASEKFGTTADRFLPAYALQRGDASARAARREVMCRLRADGFTLHQIGGWLGLHHSTVIHWTREGCGHR